MLADFYQRFEAVLPLRKQCSHQEAPQLLAWWEEYQTRFLPNRDTEEALALFKADLEVFRPAYRAPSDYLVGLVEAHLVVGQKDMAVTMLDWALRLPMQESTRVRLDAVKRAVQDPRLGKSLSDRELDILGALPATSQDEITERIDAGDGTVKKLLPQMQRDGLVQKLHGCWVASELGTLLMEQALALKARARKWPRKADES